MEKEALLNLIENAALDKRSWVNLNYTGEGTDGKNSPLTELPPEIGKLRDLKILWLRNNQLQTLPTEIGNLTNLKEIVLASNIIHTIPPEIGQLKNLTRLDLADNELTSLPPEIGQLKNLTMLDVGHNKLISLPSEICQLENLKKVYNYNRYGGSYDHEVLKARDYGWIELSGNPLKEPPLEILDQGMKAIRNYFDSIKGEDVSQLYEAKLLIVGSGDVGKTYLMNRLIYDKAPDTVSTKGIEIKQWKIDTSKTKNFRVNFWDFGGQEIYHATHQFFLTKRSLYLFVWEARKDDDLISFDYWLNTLNLLSDSAPVIIVMNKVDERTKAIDEVSLKNKFDNIISFHKVSATENIGIADLRNEIQSEIEKLPHIGDKLPTVWLDIRKKLESLDSNYISYEEYKAICGEFKLDEEKANFLSGYFHELGVFLHFGDNPVLREIVFLKSEWATNAVYKILDTREVQDDYGRFGYDQLRAIWRDYPEDKYAVLLELMKKFELCFRLGDTREYIVPELLRVEKPDPASQWNDEDNIRFEYRYDFMPAGIITRFIVRTHDIIKDELYWKNGVVLKREGTEALIVSDTYGRKMSIRVWGEDKKGLLAIIRREIDYIHDTLNNPDVGEMVPCNCSKCKEAEKSYYYKLESIKTRLQNNRHTLVCGISGEDVYIYEILGDVIVVEKEKGIRDFHVHVHKGNTMEVGKINISGGNVNFADKIGKIVYNEYLGINNEEFDKLKDTLKNLSQDKQAQLIQMSGELTDTAAEQKQTIIERIQTFLYENGVPIAQSLTAAGIFELARVFMA